MGQQCFPVPKLDENYTGSHGMRLRPPKSDSATVVTPDVAKEEMGGIISPASFCALGSNSRYFISPTLSSSASPSTINGNQLLVPLKRTHPTEHNGNYLILYQIGEYVLSPSLPLIFSHSIEVHFLNVVLQSKEKNHIRKLSSNTFIQNMFYHSINQTSNSNSISSLNSLIQISSSS
jgi:hypothetical protein